MGKSIFRGHKPNRRESWRSSAEASASARARQCPACGRKSAICTHYDTDWGFLIRSCRWCPFREERKVGEQT